MAQGKDQLLAPLTSRCIFGKVLRWEFPGSYEKIFLLPD